MRTFRQLRQRPIARSSSVQNRTRTFRRPRPFGLQSLWALNLTRTIQSRHRHSCKVQSPKRTFQRVHHRTYPLLSELHLFQIYVEQYFNFLVGLKLRCLKRCPLKLIVNRDFLFIGVFQKSYPQCEASSKKFDLVRFSSKFVFVKKKLSTSSISVDINLILIMVNSSLTGILESIAPKTHDNQRPHLLLRRIS